MPRYAIQFAYNGTPFFGWQHQEGLKTVQGDLEQAIGWVLRKPVQLTAAGRTDRGVHAEGQVAHFDADGPLPDEAYFCRRVNSIVFPHIAVLRAVAVPDAFHARFSASARQYRYEWSCIPDPLHHETTAVMYMQADDAVLDRLAARLVGTHDLSGFSKESEQHTHSVCDVQLAAWERAGNGRRIFHVRANRFLHHTVRGMVATMLAVASGKRTEADFEAVLNEGARARSGGSALAKGLVLESVLYPEPLF